MKRKNRKMRKRRNRANGFQRVLNIASPVASALSLVNPKFLAIPVIASVSNELFAYFDSKSIEKRLLQLENEVNNSNISIQEFAEEVSQLDEHRQYVVRNNVKHLCLSAQPEVTETFIKAIIDMIMNESYEMPEHICEILQQCNSTDIELLQIIKWFQLCGDKSTYRKNLSLADNKAKSGGMSDRSYFFGDENTIFWNDFIKCFKIAEEVHDMSLFLNIKLATKSGDGAFGEEVLDFAFLSRSMCKLQSLGVLQFDIATTLGTISLNQIERFHLTLFGQNLLEYIDVPEEMKNA